MTKFFKNICYSKSALALTASILIAAPAQSSAWLAITAAAQAMPSEETAERAMQLAKILNSEEIIVGDAKADEKATEFMLQLFGTQEEMQQVESDHPGIGKELAVAVLPIVNRYMLQRLPQLQQQQAELYAANFSAPQLSILVDFYSSVTGQKLIKLMTDKAQPKAMLAEAAKSEDFRISVDSALKDIRDTMPAILSDLNETDHQAIAKLSQLGLLPRLQALAPQTQKIALDWMQEYADGEELEIEKVIEATFESRLGKNSG